MRLAFGKTPYQILDTSIPFIKIPLTLAPDWMHAAMVARITNTIVKNYTNLPDLSHINCKIIVIQIRDTGNYWRYIIHNGQLQRERSTKPADVSISATLRDFILMATRQEDPDTLFFARRLTIEGDTETGLFIKNILDTIDLSESPVLLSWFTMR